MRMKHNSIPRVWFREVTIMQENVICKILWPSNDNFNFVRVKGKHTHKEQDGTMDWSMRHRIRLVFFFLIYAQPSCSTA